MSLGKIERTYVFLFIFSVIHFFIIILFFIFVVVVSRKMFLFFSVLFYFVGGEGVGLVLCFTSDRLRVYIRTNTLPIQLFISRFRMHM